jgi:hypothetical protein
MFGLMIYTVVFIVAMVWVGVSMNRGDGGGEDPAGPYAYSFLQVDKQTGEPIFYKKCEISWSFVGVAGPIETTIEESLQKISEVSGLDFQRVERGAVISIEMVSEEELQGSGHRGGRVLGEAGIVFMRDEEGNVLPMYSEVYLSQAVFDDLPEGFELYSSRGGLLLHELLHSLGMGHVNHEGSIMHREALNKPFKFSQGDILAMQKLGAVCDETLDSSGD